MPEPLSSPSSTLRPGTFNSISGRVLPVLMCDFNDIRDGQVSALRGLWALDAGARVVARDGEGCSCEGVVLQVRGQLVRVGLDMQTWEDRS